MSWLDYFRKWASKYDFEADAYGYKPQRLIRPFQHLIGKRKNGLDIGCGTGKSLQVITKFCKRVRGIEPVEKMAKQAEARGFEVLRGMGENLESTEKFDFVSFFASIDYMNSAEVVEKVNKILTEGGLVFVTVEPENEARIRRAFRKWNFKMIKRESKKAYEQQTYRCLLFERRKSEQE